MCFSHKFLRMRHLLGAQRWFLHHHLMLLPRLPRLWHHLWHCPWHRPRSAVHLQRAVQKQRNRRSHTLRVPEGSRYDSMDHLSTLPICWFASYLIFIFIPLKNCCIVLLSWFVFLIMYLFPFLSFFIFVVQSSVCLVIMSDHRNEISCVAT